MREIVIDTETTGLDPLNGHRVVEIGAVEPLQRNEGPEGSDVCLQSNLSRDGCRQPVEVQIPCSGPFGYF
jgi:DNA polymerase-3 subunit epsilon